MAKFWCIGLSAQKHSIAVVSNTLFQHKSLHFACLWQDVIIQQDVFLSVQIKKPFLDFTEFWFLILKKKKNQ